MSIEKKCNGRVATHATGEIQRNLRRVKVEVHYTATIDLTEWAKSEENNGRWTEYLISATPQADIYWEDEYKSREHSSWERFSNFNHSEEETGSSLTGLLPDGNAIRIVEEEKALEGALK